MNSKPVTPEVASQQISLRVDALKAQHPELRLSFGYIGNLERWGDDRSYRVFTNRVDDTGRSVSMHLGAWATLPETLERLSDKCFTQFLARAARCATR
jgi:hypothetical protein